MQKILTYFKTSFWPWFKPLYVDIWSEMVRSLIEDYSIFCFVYSLRKERNKRIQPKYELISDYCRAGITNEICMYNRFYCYDLTSGFKDWLGKKHFKAEEDYIIIRDKNYNVIYIGFIEEKNQTLFKMRWL